MIYKRLLSAMAILGTLGIILPVACSKKNNPSTADVTTGLVLYLPFNGNFNDASSFHNTVTPLNGASLGADMHGTANSAFHSTGAGTVLQVTNNGSYAVDTAFSVSFNFQIDTNSVFYGGYNYSGMMIFASIIDFNTGYGPTFNCGLTVPNAPMNFTFGINGDTNTCSSYGTPNPKNVITSSFIPQLHTWYNAICVYEKGTTSVYINGNLVGQATGGDASALFCPHATFIVGGWWNGTSGGASTMENLRGSMDELRFYNRVLKADQIAYLAKGFQ